MTVACDLLQRCQLKGQGEQEARRDTEPCKSRPGSAVQPVLRGAQHIPTGRRRKPREGAQWRAQTGFVPNTDQGHSAGLSGARWGQDTVNALQLLEFNLKLEKVHANHRESLDALKSFWNLLRRSGRELKQDPEHIIQQVRILLVLPISAFRRTNVDRQLWLFVIRSAL